MFSDLFLFTIERGVFGGKDQNRYLSRSLNSEDEGKNHWDTVIKMKNRKRKILMGERREEGKRNQIGAWGSGKYRCFLFVWVFFV